MQQSFPAPRPTTNPYLVMLARSVADQPGVTVRTFSWPAVLFGSYDVLHVHWPDILVTGSSPLKSLGRQALTALLLLRLRMTGVPLVRTLHNPAPHGGAAGRAATLLARLDAQTALWISLNDQPPAAPGREYEVILHGHYRDWFAALAAADAETGTRGASAVPGRLAYVGLIRPYKGVEELMDAFRGLGRVPTETASPTLQISGAPRTPELRARLERLAELDARVNLDLRYVDDAELMRVIGESELVVLPHLEMFNSGSALAALSLERPVLVPATPINARLAEEVGPGWVLQFEGPLTPAVLAEALALAGARAAVSVVEASGGASVASHTGYAAVTEPATATMVSATARAAATAASTATDTLQERPGHPDLGAREWSDAGVRHVAAYRRAIALARSGRGRS